MENQLLFTNIHNICIYVVLIQLCLCKKLKKLSYLLHKLSFETITVIVKILNEY